ncbi:MAG: hypothetical protein RLZZ312_1456 [Bacteroidota bacterium]|jgi:uncharacterized low-complexity protein
MKIFKISFVAVAFLMMSFAVLSAISWKSETIDVGEIIQNKPKQITFEFKNTGKTDVLITSAQGSCGCTATDYTKTPIKSGQSGSVTATYNAVAVGAFTKSVTVSTNIDEPKVLTLKGIVKAVEVAK